MGVIATFNKLYVGSHRAEWDLIRNFAMFLTGSKHGLTRRQVLLTQTISLIHTDNRSIYTDDKFNL